MSKVKSANTKKPSGFNIITGQVDESSKLNVWDHL
jgi:hypothetical protein